MAFINNQFSGNKRRMWALLGLIPIMIWSYYNKNEDDKPDMPLAEIALTVTQSDGVPFVYLKELNVGSVKVIDSLDIRRESKGIFYIDSKEAGFYLVQFGQQPPVVLLVQPNEKLALELNAKTTSEGYKVTASPGSVLIQEYQQSLTRAQGSIDSMKHVFESVRNTDAFAGIRPGLDMAYRKVFEEQQDLARRFITSNIQSLASVYVINQRLGPQRLLSLEQDFLLFSRLDSALMLKYPSNKHAIDHHARVSEQKRRIAEQQLAGENNARQTKPE